MESHLLQMRGLKLEPWQYSPKKWSSHLLQMRGLKLPANSGAPAYISRIFYRCVD